MDNRLSLYVPSFEELWYREKLLNDPKTMSYNRGYDLTFPGYDKETGCIAFPKEEWQSWYNYFIGNEPERFYAYLLRNEDNTFIGEVNLHKNETFRWYEMGIVIEAAHRGRNYAEEGLSLLLDYGFNTLKADAVHNSFEVEREAALRTHKAAGFTENSRDDVMVGLLITRMQWEELHKI